MAKTKPLPRGVDSLLRETVTANLLRYAAGKQICCPQCATILDWRDTVLFAGITICCACFCETASKTDMTADEKRERFQQDDLDCARNLHVDDDGKVTVGALVLTDE